MTGFQDLTAPKQSANTSISPQREELTAREKLLIAAVTAEFKTLVTDMAAALPELIAQGVEKYFEERQRIAQAKEAARKPQWEHPDE